MPGDVEGDGEGLHTMRTLGRAIGNVEVPQEAFMAILKVDE